jgi:hypothetical protein
MPEIENLFLPEIKFQTIKPEDGPRVEAAFREIKDKYNELLDFLKMKFPGEV